MPLIIPATQTLADTGFSIDNSCRFDEAEARMKRTPSSSGNRKTWTISFWWKKTSVATDPMESTGTTFFSCDGNNPFKWRTGEPENDEFQFYSYIGGSYIFRLETTQKVFRDTGAWYHILVAFDSTQGTDTNRIKVWLNGTQYTGWTTTTWPSENLDSEMNKSGAEMAIGGWGSTTTLNGLCAEFHLLDGTAVSDPDDFGERGDYGEWKPIEVSGLSYGTNGFYLDFKMSERASISSSSTWLGATGDWSFSSDDVTASSGDKALWLSDSNVFYGDFEIQLTWDSSGYTGTSWEFGLSLVSDEAGGMLNNNVINYYTASSSWWIRSREPYFGSSSQGSASVAAGSVMKLTRVGNVIKFIDDGSDSHTWSQNTTAPLRFGMTSGGSGSGWKLSTISWTNTTSSLGIDAAGGNHLTPVGITSSDQMLDTPTNNFCTWNPLSKSPAREVLSEGNLRGASDSTANGNLRSSFLMTTGKWYMEVMVENENTGYRFPYIGFIGDNGLIGNPVDGASGHVGIINNSCAIRTDGRMSLNGSHTTSWGSAFSDGDIVGVSIDADNGALYFAINNTLQNSGNPASGASKTGAPFTWTGGSVTSAFALADYDDSISVANFGQDGTFAGNKTAQGNADGNGYGNFFYAPPSGYLALCSQNLTSCAVTPSEHFSVKLYDDGAGAKTGVGFQPDLVWLKSRGSTYEHELTDAVRGVTKALSSDSNNVESTDSDGLTAFGSDGFTVGTDNNYDDTTGTGMVAWCWKGGNATLGTGDFTQGTIASTCSRNVAAGFSIVSYTGTGSNGTVGHGLSVAPNWVIVHRRTGAVGGWPTGSVQPIGSLDFTDFIRLDITDALVDMADIWNDTAPTASVFSLGANIDLNASSAPYIAYCFHNVEGYSKIGAYEGNASADGSFAYCGFRPSLVITKPIQTASSWHMYDSTRSPYNAVAIKMNAHSNAAEVTGEIDIDILSNGFKTRRVTSALSNSGEGYLFIAFAETPFKNANAR